MREKREMAFGKWTKWSQIYQVNEKGVKLTKHMFEVKRSEFEMEDSPECNKTISMFNA